VSGGLCGIFGSFFEKRPSPPVQEGTVMPNTDVAHYLRDNLPERHAQFADAYALGASASAPVSLGVSPLDFALLHAGLVDRECFYKSGGWALRPRGPQGVGDFSARWFPSDNLPYWAVDLGLLTGNVRTDDSGYEESEASPPQWAGAEIAGWGYGLGQLDFMATEWGNAKDWLGANDWKDPFVMLPKSADILSWYCIQFGSLRMGVAGYNAGIPRVSRNQNNPDAVTSGGDYSADVIARASGFGFSRAV